MMCDLMSTSPPPPAPPHRRSWWRRRLLDLLIIGGAFVAINAWQSRSLIDTGEAAPALETTTLDGAPVRLADLRGKRVQLHFWATWCGVCKMEHGALNAVHAGLGRDEALITVVADAEDPAKVRTYLREAVVRYPVWVGTPEILRAFRISRFPTNYYVAPDGRLTTSDSGWSTRWGMRTRLGCAGDG